MDGNPIKKRKEVPEEETIKKPRPKLSPGAAKAIVGIRTAPDIPWIERAIEQLCRENSWPLQLLCSEFTSRLGGLLEPQAALNTLERLRADYRAAHPFMDPPKDDYSFLENLGEQ